MLSVSINVLVTICQNGLISQWDIFGTDSSQDSEMELQKKNKVSIEFNN